MSAIVLSGCNTLPTLPESEPESIAKLSGIIQCEIQTTFANNKAAASKFEHWTATYIITQYTTDNAGVGVNPITWLAPVGVDKLLYSANLDVARESYRNGKVEYSFNLDSDRKSCEKSASYTNIKVDPSDFRLKEWVSQMSNDDTPMNNFSYSVRVQVTTAAGVGSEFENGKWTAAGGAVGSRVAVKTVDFAFTPPPPEQKPMEVTIVSQKAKGRVRRGAVPLFNILENRSIIQGQQLDRVSPNGILDR
ncbi:hypothetical protein ACIQUG_08275 [Ensifer sp. NPDC090286]|uniref:hypothetical protein n=1 Tax=Ensifer sp. NPDC090286 TaxID=3363991 RepID=UPI00383B8056